MISNIEISLNKFSMYLRIRDKYIGTLKTSLYSSKFNFSLKFLYMKHNFFEVLITVSFDSINI